MNILFGGNSKSTPTATTPMQPAAAVPRKAAFALTTAVALLALVHLVPNSTRGLDPAIVPQAATLHLPHAPAASVQQTARQGTTSPDASLVKPTTTATQSSAAPVNAAAALIDDNGALDPFYAQLWTLQQHAAPRVVTVLHYGDSPTTADLITGDVRALLQGRFGDAGHGFNLAAKPWAWYGHRDVELSDKGWASAQKDATGVGRMKPSIYGLGGAVFTGNTGAQTTYTLRAAATAPQTSAVVDYLATPGGGTLTVAANDSVLATISTAGNGPVSREIPLSANTKTIRLTVTAGTVKLFGVDFRRGNTGVLYDSLGLNGATTTVISRTFDAPAWAAELQAAHPSLIVINYGTNESQYAGLVDTLDKELRLTIDKTRTAAPGVPILIMSPMDRGEGSATGGIHTNPQIPRIVDIQQRVAAETHCAFFNTYAAMGGDGTVARWYAAKPRLVTADFIHPTPQGAEIVAQLFVGSLYSGFDRWKRAHGIGVVAVVDPVQAAAKQKQDLRAKKEAEARTKAEARSVPKRPPAPVKPETK